MLVKMESFTEFDIKTNSSETIRNIAIKIMDKKNVKDTSSDSKSRSIFFLGSKDSGKTSIINQFLDRDDSKNESLVLDYTFGRKSGMAQLVDKNICHIWELQGDISQTSPKIINIPFTAQRVLNLTIILTLDLSQANSLWMTIENVTERLKTLVTQYKTQTNVESKENYTNRTNKMDAIPIPIFIVGGKYDLYKDMDPTYKKLVSKVLRCVAVYLGAGLIFYTNKDQTPVKRIKEILNYIGFGIGKPIKSSSSHDINKPLVITPGSDSWESIGTSQCSWESIKQMYCSQHPQVSLNTDIPDDPSLDSAFRDIFIDSLRSQKDEQLKVFIENTSKNTL